MVAQPSEPDDGTVQSFPSGTLVFTFALTLLLIVLMAAGLLGLSQLWRDEGERQMAVEAAWSELTLRTSERERAVDEASGDLTEVDDRHQAAHKLAMAALSKLESHGLGEAASSTRDRFQQVWDSERHVIEEGGSPEAHPDVRRARRALTTAQQDLRGEIDKGEAEQRAVSRQRGVLVAGSGAGSTLLLLGAWLLTLSRVRGWLTRSERREQLTRLSRERDRVAIDAVGIGTWEVQLGEVPRLVWSTHAAELFGVPADPAPDVDALVRRVLKQDRPMVIAAIQEALRPEGEQSGVVTFRVLPDAVTLRWLECRGQVEFTGHEPRVPWRMAGVVRDVTDLVTVDQARQRFVFTMEAQVRARTEEADRRATVARALAVELSQAERSERRRLARMLHDGLQQLLVAARLRVALLAAQTGLDAVREELDGLLAEGIDASRSLAVELDPPVSFEMGLEPPLQWLAAWMERRHGLQVTVSTSGYASEVEPERGALVVDIVRELLFNVVKHSGVSEASIQLDQHGDHALLSVADQGRGIVVDASEEGFGTSSLNRRVRALSGSMWVDTAPDRGCKTTVRIPLPRVTYREPAAPLAQGQVLRVLVVDDHELVRHGVIALLEAEPDIDVIGSATTAEEGLALDAAHLPDVVVMDVSLPGMSGVEATRRLTQSRDDVRVIGLSAEASPSMERRLLAAGASVLVPKGECMDRLVREVRRDGHTGAMTGGQGSVGD